MIFDPWGVRVHDQVIIDSGIKQVHTFKYLGVMMCNTLYWSAHVDYLCSRLAQRLHFLHRLRLFGVRPEIMLMFL